MAIEQLGKKYDSRFSFYSSITYIMSMSRHNFKNVNKIRNSISHSWFYGRQRLDFLCGTIQ